MLKFLKKHWFSIFVTLIVTFYIGVILIVVSSPRQDTLNRGFIPCTKVMTEEILTCEKNSVLCISSAIVRNSWCDINIISEGFGKWIKGQQSRPWSNYFFEPELSRPEDEVDDDEILREYYQQNPDIKAQMEALNAKRQELEKRLNQADTEAENIDNIIPKIQENKEEKTEDEKELQQ